MNGAHPLPHSLGASGVEACLANPGTSGMHFVAAPDGVPEMRAVPTLFDGGATVAARCSSGATPPARSSAPNCARWVPKGT
jgi:thiamine pyrophosphate-dependent acetolactate synthase large subunit-like protein